MKKLMIKDIALLGLATAFFVPVVTLAGDPPPPASLNPTAAPTAPASAMYSTDAIYYRLSEGAKDAKRNGADAFAEPLAGPANGVGKTLDEIMAIAPAEDHVNGAAQTEVVSGKTYWSLRTDSTWGLQAGTRPPAPVAKSGQTTLAAAGDDGALQKGVAWPNPRFTDNNNGTVTDNLTGLIWLQNADCFGTQTWSQALSDAASLKSGDCGNLNDGSTAGQWRLPNRRELFSLLNDQYANPALSAGAPFSQVESHKYWSSTTFSSDTTYAWHVGLGDGGVGSDVKASTSHYVWPVKGGQ